MTAVAPYPTQATTTGAIAANGATVGPFQAAGLFNVWLYGTFAGTLALQRSFDGGTTWLTVSTDGTGALATYTAPATVMVEEVEWGNMYQVIATAWTSGTATVRFSAQTVMKDNKNW